MEPAYITTSLTTRLFAKSREADTKPDFAKLTPLAAETDSTASSERDGENVDAEDATGQPDTGLSVEELYPYGMTGAYWNGCPPIANEYGGFGQWPMAHDVASGFYSDFVPGSTESWPYAYNMPQHEYPGCEVLSFPPFDGMADMGSMESWSATAGEGRPPPPPMSPLLLSAPATEADVPAPPLGMPVIDAHTVEPPPGLTPASSPSAQTEPEDIAESEELLNELFREAGIISDAPPGLSLPIPSQLQRAVSTPLEAQKESSAGFALGPPPMLTRSKSSPAGPLGPSLPTMTSSFDQDGTLRIRWTVDARKLKVKDKVVVSPPFDLHELSLLGTFRMMMYPTQVSERKGGASFRKAKGKGSVHVKCESSFGEVHDGALAIRISVHSPQQEDDLLLESPQAACPADVKLPGLVIHNFAESGICSAPKDQAEWDFGKATDEDTQTFVVLLEVAAPDQEAV